MPYRITYQVQTEWMGVGTGAMTVPSAQKLQFSNVANGQNVAGGGTGGAINGTDVTTLTNAMAADIAAQMNANIGQLAAWISGGG